MSTEKSSPWPMFTRTFLLATIVFFLFNFNFEAFKAGAAVGPILGEGTPGFIAKWVTSSPMPDLTAAPSTPIIATVGTAIQFISNISNIGTAGTGVSFNNFFQVATAPAGGGTISAISVNTLTSLNNGANANVTSSLYTFPSSGAYSVRACADNNTFFVGAITESNENNNCGAWTTVTVSTALAVPVVTISANPTSGIVNVVNPALTWSATNSPTSCTASGDWSGAKAVSGTNVSQGILTTVKTYTYTLACSNATGASTPAGATVIVSASPVVTITANPPSISTGGSTTLTWSSSAASCTGTNFNTGGAPSGSISISPISTTTYTVICDGTPASVTVTVRRKPVIIED